MSGIEEIAKSWLLDPQWQKVFKHTVDVVEDYISYLLVAVGAVCLSVRLLTTLGTGDVVCMILAVEHANETVTDLGPYVSGGTLGMINYANTQPNCIRSVFNGFLEYLPYIMLLQTLVLVITEKFTFRVPRIAQRIERFYKNIVEESLFGKDPDVAEDMYNAATSTEAISRMRQRNEICVVLKRSSIIHHFYIGKNVVEILWVLIYLPLNVHFGLEDFDKEGTCEVKIHAQENLIKEPGVAHFQCHGKKMSFFKLALWAHIILLSIHTLCSIGAIFWCLFYRSVTNLLNTIEAEKGERDSDGSTRLKDSPGEDFLFLFDLLAHTCGLESTLRVLTHSDETFHEICKPNYDISNGLHVEEDKLKVSFGPCDVERWLQSDRKSAYKRQRSIIIEYYEVTIYPAESSNHTRQIAAGYTNSPIDPEKGKADNMYWTWFHDLNGGRTEYAITISVMIGKSRMKGHKVVANLLPYGAEKPRSGMMKSSQTNSIEIFWDPPKGEFTKYVLSYDKLSQSKVIKPGSMLRLTSTVSKDTSKIFEDDTEESGAKSITAKEIELSHKLQDYTILRLDPGEAYKITLATKTGPWSTKAPIEDVVMTKPNTPEGLRVSDEQPTSCRIHWFPPEDHHSCLRSYSVKIRTADNRPVNDVAVLKSSKTFFFQGLQQCMDYDVDVTAVCIKNKIRTESEPSSVKFTTLPETIKNLELVNSTTNSLTVKWAAPVVTLGIKYVLSISGDTLATDEADNDEGTDMTQKYEVASDKNQFTFSKLPDIGQAYKISIVSVYTSPREVEMRRTETTSHEYTKVFMTRPLPPTELSIDDKEKLQIKWQKSQTPNVVNYKVTWKANEDGSNKNDGKEVIPCETEDDFVYFKFDPKLAEDNTSYKVNVYAIAKCVEEEAESKELHEKFTFTKDPLEITLFE